MHTHLIPPIETTERNGLYHSECLDLGVRACAPTPIEAEETVLGLIEHRMAELGIEDPEIAQLHR